jgi:hydrogenase small subunit
MNRMTTDNQSGGQTRYTRRDILRMGAALAASAGLGATHATVMADGLREILSGHVKVLWLQGLACDGCTISFLNADEPGPLEILTQIISLVYHPTLSAAQGEMAMETVRKATSEGEYVFVFEGSVPSGMPKACIVGGVPLAELLPPVLEKAKTVMTVGTCASFGGVPAAEGNATGAVSLRHFMERSGMKVKGRLINCPGCPVHPQSVLGTLAYLAAGKWPNLNPELLTPDLYYKNSVHDECPRFHHWEKHEFASQFGEEGCLFNLGCLGPLSHTNCPRRQWNGGVNWCIRAGSPCTGCTSETFARMRAFPFYRKGADTSLLQVPDVRKSAATP